MIFVLFLINLGFILHNIIKYIFGLRILRPLIVAFYALISTMTLLRIVETGVRIYATQTAFFGHKQIFYRSD